MPSFAHVLDDEQPAAVLSIVRQSWGNAAAPASHPDVPQLRQGATR